MSIRMVRHAAQACVLAVVAMAPVAAHAGYILSEVVRPGAESTALFDINNNGLMVGYSTNSTGGAQGFLYDGTSFTGLTGPAGAVSSAATGLSDSGVVVGSYLTSDTGPQQGFIYSGGTYSTFNVAGATDTFLRGISPDGRYISGYYTTATVLGTGFVFDNEFGTLTIVSAVDSLITIPQAINSSYVVVGSDIRGGPPVTRPGFTYDLTTNTRVDGNLAVAERTALRAIDDAGILAGWYVDAAGDVHGFVGSLAAFEQIDFAGALQTFVEGSNNDGVLVGTFNAADRSGAFIARTVPEPGTLALFALGLAGTLLSRRRRQEL